MLVRLTLDLVDYINKTLMNDELTKREENSLKMIKAILCDYVSSCMQKRKEKIYVPERTEPRVDYDSDYCQ